MYILLIIFFGFYRKAVIDVENLQSAHLFTVIF